MYPKSFLAFLAFFVVAQAVQAEKPGRRRQLKPHQELIVAAYRLDVAKVKSLIAMREHVNTTMGFHDDNLFEDRWSGGIPLGSERWTPLLAVASSNRHPQPKKEFVLKGLEDLDRSVEEIKKIPQKIIQQRNKRRLEIVKLLLKAGAKLDEHDGYGSTALMIAVKSDYHECALLIIQSGADVNTKTKTYIDDPGGYTPLHYAVDNHKVLKALIDHGAKVNAQDGAGVTPLHTAAYIGQVECVRLLLKAGADVGIKNRRGATAADSAKFDIFYGEKSEKFKKAKKTIRRLIREADKK